MWEPTLIEWFIFVILIIILIGLIGLLWVYGIREPKSKPPDYTINRSIPLRVRFVFGIITFILALIGGGIFLLIMYVADLYPEKELITFGVPLLFAFAFVNALLLPFMLREK